jgi:hypothetical protein
MIPILLSDLKIKTDLSPQTATISISLGEPLIASLGGDGPWSLAGRIRGPFCVRSHTLAANYPLRPLRDGSTIAIIPDFCAWTPHLPFTYELQLEARQGEQVFATSQANMAVHSISMHHGKFYQGGKRWAPRLSRLTMNLSANPVGELEATRMQDLALVLNSREATSELLANCQKLGVFVAVEVSEGAPSEEELARWESFGCVFLLLLPDGIGLRETRLFVAHRKEQNTAEGFHQWQVSSGVETSGQVARARLAALDQIHTSEAGGRRACDALQAQSASQGDWAGFIG